MNIKLILLLVVLAGCKPVQKNVAKDYTAQNTEALIFCKKNNFNTDYYILIDLSLHSGKNRFFVYNFKNNKNDFGKLTSHGTCDAFEANDKMWEKAKTSNKIDSHCSATGKYKIGKRDYSTWGIKVKYWLHGLEKSNSNSVARVTVLHSWEKISDTAVYPNYSPLSWGCPAVSNNFMETLDKKLQQTNLPVLLWIIN